MPLFLPPSSVSLSNFTLTVPMRGCLGKHSCMSPPFPIAILNGTIFFRSVKAMNNWKRSAIKQFLLPTYRIFTSHMLYHHPSSNMLLVHSFHVAKPSQHTLINSTCRLAFHFSPSSQLSISLFM